ncbi:hypothetical protein HWV62_41517 [Athelia sp. TMB]|nr:hypothetical protein HWV62_41517 [Athelia sp. TMB]
MNEYQENAFNARKIRVDEFFYRFDLEHKARRLMPHPSGLACLCNRLYNPDEREPENLMHTCPRKDCRRAWHRGCLLSHGFVSNRPEEGRERFLKSDPDASGTLGTDSQPPRKKARIKGKGKRQQKASVEDEDESGDEGNVAFLATLPAPLVRAALQPILKPWPPSSPMVSGNVSRVINARRLVLQALKDGEVAEGWEEFVGLDGEDEDDMGGDDADEQEVERVMHADSGTKRKKSAANGRGAVIGKQTDVKSKDPELRLVCPLCLGPI